MTLEYFRQRVTNYGTDLCWEWTSYLNQQGYGHAMYQRKRQHAHRWSLEVHGIPLIKGLHVDHICRNRKCCNPKHLRQVTCRENLIAPGSLHWSRIAIEKTHCIRGHELSGSNLIKSQKRRKCRICMNEVLLPRYRAKLKLRKESKNGI